MKWLYDFVQESNRIEGIVREPSDVELEATFNFIGLHTVDVEAMVALVSVYQPGAVLRDRAGLDVRVGRHVPPRGAPMIREHLAAILGLANTGAPPFTTHCDYEWLHPFTDGNGRSGRAV